MRGLPGALFALALLLSGPASTAAADAPEADWLEGLPLADGLPSGEDGRHFRVRLSVASAGAVGQWDLPVQVEIDLAAALADAGFPSSLSELGLQTLQGFTLDPDSFTLREVDAQGAPVSAARLPVRTIPVSSPDGRPFDPASNPRVLAIWVMPGRTEAARHFHLYFDSLQHGDHPAHVPSLEELLPLATAIGPGRGTRLYLAFPSLPARQGDGEARRVWVTSLSDGPNAVKIFEYDGQGRPKATPTRTLTLTSIGDAEEYVLGDNGLQQSSGGVLVVADRPVHAEGLFVKAGQRGSYKAAQFLPASDGGFWGRSFVANNPGDAESWTIHCPATLAGTLATGARGCTFTVDGTDRQLRADRSVVITAGAGIHRIEVQEGRVGIQRSGTGLVAWPPADGPVASRFLAQAGPGDDLLASAAAAGTCLKVDSFGAGQPPLAGRTSDKLCLAAAGALNERASWGTSWGRPWETDNQHLGGPVTIEGHDGAGNPRGGLQIISGSAGDPAAFTALVTPQSRDGGLSYDVFVPTSQQGTSLGRLVLYSPFAGAMGTATLDSTMETVPIGPLVADERVDLPSAGPGGFWHVKMDRPVLAFWLKPGINPFGGLAAGLTSGAAVTLAGADYLGPALAVDVDARLQQGQAGTTVRFKVNVRNEGRSATGRDLPDTASIAVADVPPGWTAKAVPHSVPLPPGQTASVDVLVTIPPSASSGDSLSVKVASGREPRLVVDEALFVNLAISRAVEVLIDEKADVTEELAEGQTGHHLVVVANRGSVPDSYRVQLSPPLEWSVRFSSLNFTGDPFTTPVLKPGETTLYHLNVTPPAESLGAQLITTVQAKSLSSTSVRDSATLTSTVGGNRTFRIDVENAVLHPNPGEVARFVVRVKNLSELNLEFTGVLQSTAPRGWQAAEVFWVERQAPLASFNGSRFAIDPAGEQTFVVSRPVPAEARPFEASLDRFRLTQVLGKDQQGHKPATDVPLRVSVAPAFGLTIVGPAPVPLAVPGTAIDLPFTLASTANVAQQVQVAAIAPIGWRVEGPLGAVAPWNVTVPVGQAASIMVRLHVPPEALPSTGDLRLALLVTAPGQPARTASVPLDVPSRTALHLVADRAVVAGGRTTTAFLPVFNGGNTPATATVEATGLPAGFVVVAAPVLVPANSTVAIPVAVEVPTQTKPGALACRIRLFEDGSPADDVPWELVVGGPVLRVEALGSTPLGSERVQQVRIYNEGTDPAFNVTVRWIAANGSVVDSFRVHQILAGASSLASLVGPSQGDSLLQVTSDDGAGIDVPLPPSAAVPAHGLPGPTAGILLCLALLAAVRRRRRE